MWIWIGLALATWSWASRGGVGYGDAVRAMVEGERGHGLSQMERIQINAKAILSGIPVADCVFPGFSRLAGHLVLRRGLPTWAIDVIGAVLTVSLVGLAWILVIRKRPVPERLCLLALLGNAVLAAPIPYGIANRYALVAVPFAVVWVWRLADALPGRAWRWAMTAGLASIVGAHLVFSPLWTEAILSRLWSQMKAERADLDECAAFLRERVAPEARIGAGFFVDASHLHLGSGGRRFIVDYLAVPNHWGLVAHEQQGFASIQYVVLSGSGGIRPEVAGICTEVFRATNGCVVVCEVDSAKEAAWRDRVGYPAPGKP